MKVWLDDRILADELFGNGVIKPPVAEMVKANTIIEGAPLTESNETPGFMFLPSMAILILYARINRNSK